jgi:hypothetical protein
MSKKKRHYALLKGETVEEMIFRTVFRGFGGALDTDQCDTFRTSPAEIMQSAEFAVGVTEIRTGQPPNYDTMDDWNYERGRLWATMAPANLDPRSARAVRMFMVALKKGYII